MGSYENKALEEAEAWKNKIIRKSGMMSRMSKQAQIKINGFIPEKAHGAITETFKSLIEGVLKGTHYLAKNKKKEAEMAFSEREEKVKKAIQLAQKTGMLEGAGTGAGGIFFGLADFPLLLGIKMKLLFEIAALYGFNANRYEERAFILYVFQLAFSSGEVKKEMLDIILNWEESTPLKEPDWRVLQQEYRDYIDIIKTFQLVPGIGAAVGAYANRVLIAELGETAMNCFRLRMLSKNREEA
ncbi:EcsC family protein [Peribacillus sp. B-H-3]|uniref:EcsC family protein n=1 Tax=Peribacillus sp. B-H-3 TaxID=3400420 RepID=UPI003B01118D